MSSDSASLAQEATIDSYRIRPGYPKKFLDDRKWNFIHGQKLGKPIIVYLSHCPEKHCSRCYVDTLVGRYYFICMDERHNGTSLEGNVN